MPSRSEAPHGPRGRRPPRSAGAFVDTSAWYAFLDASHPSHAAVCAAFEEHAAALTTTDYILDELVTLVRHRAGHGAALRAGTLLLDPGALRLEHIQPADASAAWELFSRRPDKEYSFTDCTSFVVMRRLGLTRALTLDADFRQESFEVLP